MSSFAVTSKPENKKVLSSQSQRKGGLDQKESLTRALLSVEAASLQHILGQSTAVSLPAIFVVSRQIKTNFNQDLNICFLAKEEEKFILDSLRVKSGGESLNLRYLCHVSRRVTCAGRTDTA